MLPLNTPRTLRDAKRGLPSLGDAIHSTVSYQTSFECKNSKERERHNAQRKRKRKTNIN